MALSTWDSLKPYELPLTPDEEERIRWGGALWFVGVNEGRLAVRKITDPNTKRRRFAVFLPEEIALVDELDEAITRFTTTVKTWRVRGWMVQDWWVEHHGLRSLVQTGRRIIAGKRYGIRQETAEPTVMAIGHEWLGERMIERAECDLERRQSPWPAQQ